MYNKEATVDGPNNTKIVGRVTEVSGSNIWEVESSNGDKYERCPITNKFYKK